MQLVNDRGIGVGCKAMAKLKPEELAEAVMTCINSESIKAKAKEVGKSFVWLVGWLFVCFLFVCLFCLFVFFVCLFVCLFGWFVCFFCLLVCLFVFFVCLFGCFFVCLFVFCFCVLVVVVVVVVAVVVVVLMEGKCTL